MFRSAILITAVTLLVGPSQVTAQLPSTSAHQPYWQLIVSSGTVIPTGAQRASIERGNVTAAQLTWMIRPSLAMTGSFGWARTRDITTIDTPRLHLFTWDAGTEVRAPRRMEGGPLSLRPFAGIGVGGRTYDLRDRAGQASHEPAAYISLGGEVGVAHRVTLRLEARDYLSRASSTAGRSGGARNDVTLMAGLRLGVR